MMDKWINRICDKLFSQFEKCWFVVLKNVSIMEKNIFTGCKHHRLLHWGFFFPSLIVSKWQNEKTGALSLLFHLVLFAINELLKEISKMTPKIEIA